MDPCPSCTRNALKCACVVVALNADAYYAVPINLKGNQFS
jgi:hypothetical protein